MVYFDGHNDGTEFTIRVKIKVEDDHITFDYADTDAQTDGFVNGTFTSSASATILTLLQMVNPDIPHNEGMIRPIEILIPEAPSSTPAIPRRRLSATISARPTPMQLSGPCRMSSPTG